jgi:hypothetical protein
MTASFVTASRGFARNGRCNALFSKAGAGARTALGQGGHYRFGNQFLKEFKLDKSIPGVTINGLRRKVKGLEKGGDIVRRLMNFDGGWGIVVGERMRRRASKGQGA